MAVRFAWWACAGVSCSVGAVTILPGTALYWRYGVIGGNLSLGEPFAKEGESESKVFALSVDIPRCSSNRVEGHSENLARTFYKYAACRP
jgi:hypothetical protein